MGESKKVFEHEYADRYSKPCPKCHGAQEVAVVVKDGSERHASGNALLRLVNDGWEIERFVPCQRCNQVGRVPKR